MRSVVDHALRLSFGAAAADYDRFRPRYPDEAVSWAAAGPPPRRVVDLGAGTGILTRILLALGYDAVPVEPDEGMRAQLAAATPGTTALAGSAETIPLGDGEADGVVAGQAYHWFERDRAHAEAARVLRAGGTFAALWNVWDETVPWVAELRRITGPEPGYRGAHDSRAPESFGDRFDGVERGEFRHDTTHTADTLVNLIATRSYYITAGPQRQRELDVAVRDLVATHPDLAGRYQFELPYRTFVYRARRR
jgi:SAM-dependent methyltransferase